MKPRNFAGRKRIRRLRAVDRAAPGYKRHMQDERGARADSRADQTVADMKFRVGVDARNADGTTTGRSTP